MIYTPHHSSTNDKELIMKMSGFLHLTFAKYFFFISCAAWASTASAYLKMNFESSDLIWQSEEYRLDNIDYAYEADFFRYQTINFDVEFIIPEFEFPVRAPVLFTYDDVVVGIKTSNLFASPRVTNSRFELELAPEDDWYPFWTLTFDVVDNQNPENDGIRSGTYSAVGSIEWNADGSGTGGAWGDFVYHLDNWVYPKHNTEWILDSEVHFVTEFSRLTIEKVSVPEPLSPALLLLGLAGIFAARKMKVGRSILIYELCKSTS